MLGRTICAAQPKIASQISSTTYAKRLTITNAKIWHNTDRQEQTPEDNRQTLAGMVTRISERVYADRRIDVFPEGFVQQHVLHGTRIQDGERLSLPACVICRVENGKITRLDEYFDSAHVAQFRKFADS